MKEIISKFDRKEVLLILILIVFAIIISFQLFFNPFSKTYEGMDTFVFAYIGESMHDGQIPYKDIFDHKGPFLYFINYLGTFLETTIGIWIIEVVFLIISTIFIYKISKLIVKSKKVSLIISIFIMFTMGSYTLSGNYVEEFALPFILISLYLYIDLYLNKDNLLQITSKKSLIIGICCGFVLMLRINMAVVWLVYSVFIFFDLLKKDRKALLKYITYFIIGNLIVIIPFCIYLLINDAFGDFIHQYIIFNFIYSAENTSSIENSFLYFATISPVLIFCLILFFIKSENKKLKYINFIFFIMTFIIVILPGNEFAHYGIILLPAYIYPLCNMCDFLIKRKIYFIVIVLFMSIIFCSDIFYTIFKIIYINTYTYQNGAKEIIEYINTEKEENDKLVVLGNYCNFYIETNLEPCSKYVYQIPIAYIDKQIIVDTINDIKNKNPKFIIKDRYNLDENMEKNFKFIDNSNKYKKVIDDDYVLYERIN